MKYLVELPHHINDSNVPTVKKFYVNLLYQMEYENLQFDIKMKNVSTSILENLLSVFQNKQYSKAKYDYIFRYHTKIKDPKTINIKISYLPDYFYMDETGYSGWAKIANERPNFQKMKINKAEKFHEGLCKKYVEQNVSKYHQEDRNQNFSKYEPYVFIPTQVVDDEVADLAYVNIIDLLKEIPYKIQRQGFNVLIKRHPKCKSDKIKDILSSLDDEEGINVVKGSIHDIISSSSAVAVVNSGVGFEALLHLKPVINFGHCDYHWVTRTIKDKTANFEVNRVIENTDTTDIKKFLYFYLKEYLVDINSDEDIRNKINEFSK